jgi:hypothetical protein
MPTHPSRARWRRVLPLVVALAPAGLLAQPTHPILTAIPPNTARDLGPYTSDPLCGVPIGVTDYSRFTYDPVRHQLLMFGGGHATTPRTDVDVFSFSTLTWTSAYPPTPESQLVFSNYDPSLARWISTGHPIARHTYDQLVLDPGTGDLVMLARGHAGAYCTGDWGWESGRVGHYDHETRAWSFSPTADNTYGSGDPYPAAEYDPVSGLIVVVAREGLWTYDPATRARVERLSYSLDMGYANNLVYFPPNQRMYYIARGSPTRVFEVVLDRANWSASTVTELVTTGDVFDSEESGFAYDSWNHVIGGGVSGGVFRAFDPATRRWSSAAMTIQGTGGPIGTQAFHALDFDPVDGVFLFLTGYDDGSRMWAYRYGSGTPATLSIDDVTVAEGDAGATPAVFTARLSQAIALPVTVAYATANQSAAAGSDYQAASGTISFAPGAVTRTVSVDVLGDTAVETDETFVVTLSGAVGATLADGQAVGTISDDDAPPLGRRELGHGSDLRDDASAATGTPGTDAFRIAQAPRSSYEIVLDAASGDLSPVLERLAADQATLLQAGAPVGTGGALALRWENTSGAAVTNQPIRVRSDGCGTACGADDTYRLRAWETTGSIPRFNNGGSQVTVLILQSTLGATVAGRAQFWSAAGAFLGAHVFTLGPRATLVVATATIPGLAGQSGSITVSHDGGYGALAGKAVSLEPATGFSFDSGLRSRPR